jgi:dipeptidyl-peptidase-4
MKRLLLFLLIVLAAPAIAQNKLLSIEDAMVKNRSTLAPASVKQLQFLYGTEDYVFLADGTNTHVSGWVMGSLNKSSKGSINISEVPFLTLQQLNSKLKTAGRDTFTTMPAIRFDQSPEWVLTVKGEKIALDPKTNNVRVIIPKSIASKSNVEASTAGYIAYVDNHNLFVSDGTKSNQVTKDGSENIVYASSVHRDEFGINKGTFWSNNGKLLAFYRMDQSMVTDYPVIDWTQTPAKNVNIKYPMAGDSSHQVTVGVYDLQNGKLIYLQTGTPADQYLTNVSWSPDDKSIFIAVLNREQNHMKLNEYDASTGSFKRTLFEEKDERYVEPLNAMLFVKNNPSQFIWQSRRDGWNHLYLYNINGQLIKQLTKGEWEVTEVKGFDAAAEHLFYISTQESPITKNIYKLNLKNNSTTRLSNDYGVHTAILSTSGKTLLDTYSSAAQARAVNVTQTATGKSFNIFTADDPLKDYRKGEMSVFTFNGANGTQLYGRMYKPVDFDSTRKYPVVVYWYGGPHAQMITAGYNGGAGDYWFQYMAQRGYLVFSLDTRGSSNRGKAFEQSIFRNHGAAQMEDMMSAVNYLSALSYADTSKMGLFGWSYGGFMTTNFMFTHPGVFKAAVAGGPVVDWRLYEIMYGERYMDTPKENPEGYAATDLTKKIANLQGKLLLIHGQQDPVVVQQHSVKLVRAAIDKGVQVDYMIYPGHEHNVTGKDRAHLYQKVTDYLVQYLK